jgi:hypothetical protein
MRSLKFVTKGLSIVGANDWREGVTARQNTVSKGIDLYFENDQRRYRLDFYDARPEGVVKTNVQYMHESRIDIAEAWDA